MKKKNYFIVHKKDAIMMNMVNKKQKQNNIFVVIKGVISGIMINIGEQKSEKKIIFWW